MQLNAIVWNVDPEILPLGSLSLRWYGLLFALGFVFGYIIFQNIFKREKISYDLLDKLLVYMAIGTVVGARLGHCLFYDPHYYLSHPVEILKVWEGGLASHGAAIGILIALGLFVIKYKFSYVWVLDRMVIVVALAGALIRTGNLMNSEIYGISTKSTKGFVFPHDLTRDLIRSKVVEKVSYRAEKDSPVVMERFIPITMDITLKKQLQDTSAIANFMHFEVARLLATNPGKEETDYYFPAGQKLQYSISRNAERHPVVTTTIYGVPKYPTQIMEAGSYLLIFLLLYGLYLRFGTSAYKGLSLSLFFILVFGARFGIEYIKELQSAFEATLPLDMGQLLSIPFILAGFIILILAVVIKKPSIAHNNK